MILIQVVIDKNGLNKYNSLLWAELDNLYTLKNDIKNHITHFGLI